MTKNPLVTVLMSVYNGEKYLAEAIESILNQTFVDYEFMIINDGSIDASREIILSYHDPRITFVDNYKNIGIPRSVNKGISLAKGKYIARMDADDISLPERLERQVAFMDANEEVAVCGARGVLINENGQKVGDIAPTAYTSEEINAKILIMNQFIHPVVVIRKKCMLEIGGYNKKAQYAEDYRMWIDLLINNYKLYNLDLILIKYRIHVNSVSVKNNEIQEESACKIVQYGLKKLYKKRFPLKDIKLMRKVYFYKDPSITEEDYRNIIDKFSFLLQKDDERA